MRVLLLAGLGPTISAAELLTGSVFDANVRVRPQDDLSGFRVRSRDGDYPLLRPFRGTAKGLFDCPPGPYWRPIPHLTTLTLESILRHADVDYVTRATDELWRGTLQGPDGPFDAVLLSTTFIWERRSLARAIRWIEEWFPSVRIVLGGQYSNLKYRQILANHPSVTAVVLGDAEVALPALLNALDKGTDLSAVPNLALRDDSSGALRQTVLQYSDLELEPSPTVAGDAPVVPYESMRGCPFSCRFCSFPAASPTWRYKSAEKIRDDFTRYRDRNGTRYVKALDSTFTVPPARLRRLLPMLEGLDIGWEAYSRANALTGPDMVARLEASGCSSLALGFESMSDRSLSLMNKQVSASANRTAFELLSASGIDYRVSFMVGYPGEFPTDFDSTRRFLVEEYAGRFTLNVFSLSDETMPVWADAEHAGLVVSDPDDPDAEWSHVGMDRATANTLRRETLRDVRWANDGAVHNLWQGLYEMPLAPTLSAKANLRIEKLIDRLGMVSVDFPDESEARRRRHASEHALDALGVDVGPVDQTRRATKPAAWVTRSVLS